MSDHRDDEFKPQASKTTTDDDGTIDFNSYVPPADGGTGSMQQVHVSEPVSGTSGVSWAELLRQRRRTRQPSSDEISIGSLAELQVDAVSDKDILRSLERQARDMASGGSGIILKEPGQPARQSGIRKNAAIAPIADPARVDWTDDAPPVEVKSGSSIDLRTAAGTANRAFSDDDSAHVDEEDALSSALMADDGSSAINLGLEPRVASLLSSAAIVREIRKAEETTPAAGPPVVATPGVSASKRSPRWLGWLGGAVAGVLLTIGAAASAWYGNMLPAAPVANASAEGPTVHYGTQPAPAADPRIADLAAKQKALETSLESATERLRTKDTELLSAREQAERSYKELQLKLSQAQTELAETEAALNSARQSSAAGLERANKARKEAEQREAEVRTALAEATKVRHEVEQRLATDTAVLREQVANLRGQLGRTRTADTLLEIWPVLLDKPSPQVAALALKDADAVLADRDAGGTARAKALVVTGLAQLAADDFDAARKTLLDAAGNPALPTDGVWRERIDQSLALLTDVEATVDEARGWLSRGDKDRALAAANRGMRIFHRSANPNDYARLLDVRNEAAESVSLSSEAAQDAERHFATGVRHYFGRRFADAESAFLAATKLNGDDARYAYFLGLAQLSLGKAEAADESLRTAAALEKRGKPGTLVLNRVFERVQGPTRQRLDSYRK